MAEIIRPHFDRRQAVATLAAVDLALDALPPGHVARAALVESQALLRSGLALAGASRAVLPAHAFADALAAETIRPGT